MNRRPPSTKISVCIEDGSSVSGLLDQPSAARAGFVLAHGAGADMTHPFLEAVASGLFERQVATLRYQFPYSERGSRRPDRPAVAQAAVRAAVGTAARALGDLPLFAGGKSFGGRMTSQAQAATALAGVRGLAFLGFPLHAAKKPSVERADHLAAIAVPMLFIQGTRDALADIDLITLATRKLGGRTRLVTVEDADHSFHVPARSGRSDAEVMTNLLDTLADWFETTARAG